MPKARNKGIRSQWSNEQLEEAITAIRNGLSKNAASARYNISRRTLKRYLDNNISEKVRMGRKTTLNDDQERELSGRIVRLAEVGYPITNKILRKCVFKYCEENTLPHPFSKEKNMAGRYWLKGFMQRHPEISVRKAQSMNPARAQKLNKFIVEDYFGKLKTVLEDLDLMDKPERIFNVDEKGCRLTLHHQQAVLAKRGAKRVHLVAPEHGENVTIVACANANGAAIPPTVLFKGRRMKPEWKDNLPHGTLALMTPKGSMNVDTFVIWLEHLAKYKLEGTCLLIFDGAFCHLDHSIVDAANKHNITLLCLPSNTTHELQPMDKSVFRSFEHHWDEQVLLFWTKYKDRALTKQRFGEIFSIVWDKAMTPSNIKSGFIATGIFPYNPGAIPEIAFAPSIFTEQVSTENQVRVESFVARQTTQSPTPGCSYKSPEETRTQAHRKTPFYKTKNVGDESSSDSSGDYTSTSDDSCDEIIESDHNDTTIADQAEKNSILTENCVSKRDKTTEEKTLNMSFTEMLDTPAKVAKTTKNRKKTINSRAIVVKKDVFLTEKNKENDKMDSDKSTFQTQAKGKENKLEKLQKPPRLVTKKTNKEKVQDWFCKICARAEIKDMRLCCTCLVYVHEECVGWTKFDKEQFICPDCN